MAAAGDCEPESLKALKAALAAREQFAQKLTATLEEAKLLDAQCQQQNHTAADSQDVAEAVAAFTLLANTSLAAEYVPGCDSVDAPAACTTAGSAPAAAIPEQGYTSEHAGSSVECVLHHALAVGVNTPTQCGTAEDQPAVTETGPAATAVKACHLHQAADVALQEHQSHAASSNWRSDISVALTHSLATEGAIAATVAGAYAASADKDTAGDIANSRQLTQHEGLAGTGSTGLQQPGISLDPAAAAVADAVAAERGVIEAAQQQLIAQDVALQQLLQQQVISSGALLMHLMSKFMHQLLAEDQAIRTPSHADALPHVSVGRCRRQQLLWQGKRPHKPFASSLISSVLKQRCASCQRGG